MINNNISMNRLIKIIQQFIENILNKDINIETYLSKTYIDNITKYYKNYMNVFNKFFGKNAKLDENIYNDANLK